MVLREGLCLRGEQEGTNALLVDAIGGVIDRAQEGIELRRRRKGAAVNEAAGRHEIGDLLRTDIDWHAASTEAVEEFLGHVTGEVAAVLVGEAEASSGQQLNLIIDRPAPRGVRRLRGQEAGEDLAELITDATPAAR